MLNKGFSLIELMIVVAIVGIIASIAYPSYKEYITRARRTDGQTALLDLASRMERYYSEQNSYANAIFGTSANSVRSSNLSPESWYQLTITSTAATYVLQAIPRNTQITDDRTCQTLTLNHLGVKGIAAGPGGLIPTGPLNKCW